ncbi:MAG: hypothetical protein IAE79_23850 [Anaerolinea sp.]|nr:hypothetical protein [Anaerolinea sp.]
MEITRNVILDLIPLYLAGEVTDDTRQLVEHYLHHDPKLAKLVELAANEKLPEDIPMPINKESEMKTFQKVRLLTLQHHIFLGLSLVFSILWVIFAFGKAVEPEIPMAIPVIFFFTAAFFWTGFLNVIYQINKQA